MSRCLLGDTQRLSKLNLRYAEGLAAFRDATAKLFVKRRFRGNHDDRGQLRRGQDENEDTHFSQVTAEDRAERAPDSG